MARAAIGILALAVLAYAGLCALVFFQQRSLMYFPVPPTPTPAGAVAMELPVDGARVTVTVFGQERRRALLYFGGNAEDVNGSLGGLSAAFPDHAIYLMHYRGYGNSSGEPSEAALVSDALALYDQVTRKHAAVAVAGRSLGSGVAIQLASARPVERLVLVTPFDSMRHVAAAHYRYLPVRWLMRETYDSLKHAQHISAPTTLIAAAEDRIIRPAHARALWAAFPQGVATMTVIAGVGHNDIESSPRYLPALRGEPAVRTSHLTP
ncbi:MAG TPA: hypothetical protein VGE60_02695 [Telluria sp.]